MRAGLSYTLQVLQEVRAPHQDDKSIDSKMETDSLALSFSVSTSLDALFSCSIATTMRAGLTYSLQVLQEVRAQYQDDGKMVLCHRFLQAYN